MVWNSEYRRYYSTLDGKRDRPSWRRLLREVGPRFSSWLDDGRKFDEQFGDLASALLEYLKWKVTTSDSAKAFCSQLVAAIPLVLSQCDEQIYDNELIADAYAFVHLLERYRRTRNVLQKLQETGLLPLREKALNVLDVGAGPGPTTYATSDYYGLLKQYGRECGVPVLAALPAATLHPIESSPSMATFLHFFSEIAKRPGPFFPSFREFQDVDLEQRRTDSRYIGEKWNFSDGTVLTLNSRENFFWKSNYRYQMAIFSYFLTTDEVLQRFEDNVASVLDAITLGGIVIVLGGRGQKYEPIYASLAVAASKRGFERVFENELVTCDYDNAEASQIKLVYDQFWHVLDQHCDTDHVKTLLQDMKASTICEPTVSYKGQDSFVINAWRREQQMVSKRSSSTV